MGLTIIDGLPAHILFVHFVVVLVPVTALAVVACAIWPAWARRLGMVLPLLGLVTLGMVPVTTHAGEWLEQHVDGDPLVRRHAELGDTLLPWAAGLFLVSAAVWWLGRRSADVAVGPGVDGGAATARTVRRMSWTSSTGVRAAASVLSLAVAAGAVVDVYRIGDSGAKASWHDGFSRTATSQGR